MRRFREALRNYEATYARCPNVPEYAENLALGVQSLMNACWKRSQGSGGEQDAESNSDCIQDLKHLAQIMVTLFNADYGTSRTELAITSARLAKHFAWSFVICQHRLGNPEAATARYAEGIRWLESHDKKDDPKLNKLRDDAAQLLEVKPEQPDGDEAGQDASPSVDSL